MKFNILVFPCGSEIGLEIFRSLRFSRHVTLYGASSAEDHGKFVYKNYISGLPYYNNSSFVKELKHVIKKNKIDAVYPAMDSIVLLLKEIEKDLDCKVIAPTLETAKICLSKLRTYDKLKNLIRVPHVFSDIQSINRFPVFLKPDNGYGSRGTKIANSLRDVENHMLTYPNILICEYLPGKEFTVDCFTDKKGILHYFGVRERIRTLNGISVNTKPYEGFDLEISKIVSIINEKIKFSGAWFIQLKQDSNGELALLEIAARLGGSSSLNRNRGVNFALLSIFNAFDLEVEVFTNTFQIELDRALDNKYKLSIQYQTVYCDFDDCLILDEKINTQLLSFLFQCINDGVKIILLTKHEKDINLTLKEKRLSETFDEIIHITSGEKKYDYIKDLNSIFIDDSHLERKEVFDKHGIPVFAPDNVECLIK